MTEHFYDIDLYEDDKPFTIREKDTEGLRFFQVLNTAPSSPIKRQIVPSAQVQDTIVNIITGVVLAYITPGDESFEADTPERVDWVLEKISGAEAEASGLKLEVIAITDRIVSKIKTLDRRVDWFKERFGDGIRTVALTELAGGKGKTWTRPYGAVSFRKDKDKMEVSDHDMAVRNFGQRYPECVQTTVKFLKGNLTKEQRKELEFDAHHSELPCGVEFTPAGDDKMTIKAVTP